MIWKRALWAMVGFCLAAGSVRAGGVAQAKLDGADALFAQRKYEKAAVAYLEAAKAGGADAASSESAQLGAIQCLRQEKAYDAFRSAGEAFLKARDAKAAETDGVRKLKITLARSWFSQGNYATAAAKLDDYVAAHAADAQGADASAAQELFDAVATRAVALDRAGAKGGRALLLEYSNKFSDPEQAGRLKIYAAGFLRDAGDMTGFKRELAATAEGNWSADSRLAFDAQWELARFVADQDGPTSAAAILGNYIDKYPNSKWAFKAAAQRDHWLVRARRYDEAREAMRKFATTRAGTADGVEAGFRAAQSLYDDGKYSDFMTEGAALLTNNPDYQGAARNNFDYQMSVAPLKAGDPGEAVNRLEIFINDYPKFRGLNEAKVYLGAAKIQLGDKYATENNVTSATTQRALGRAALKEMILKMNSEVTSKTKTLSPLRMMILDAHYFAGDYAGLAEAAQKLVGEQASHSLLWAKATFWHGVALTMQTSADLAGAAGDFDAVIASGVTDGNLADHIESQAAQWRLYVAGRQNDVEFIDALGPTIKALPDGPIKTAALRTWKEKTGSK